MLYRVKPFKYFPTTVPSWLSSIAFDNLKTSSIPPWWKISDSSLPYGTNALFFCWLCSSAHSMWWKMYLGRLTFSKVTKKCKNTLCSKEGWSTPPPLGRKHSYISFWRTLCSYSISLYFPSFLPLKSDCFTTSIQSQVFLLWFHWNAPSSFLLRAFPITSLVMVIGIPITFERISTLLNFFSPFLPLIFLLVQDGAVSCDLLQPLLHVCCKSQPLPRSTLLGFHKTVHPT